MSEPKKLKRVVIKEELFALTGDFKEAIILNQFIYWSERIRDFDKLDADIVDFNLEELAYELNRICSGSLYIFCSTEQVSFLRDYLSNKKMTTRLCIWEKTNPSPDCKK